MSTLTFGERARRYREASSTLIPTGTTNELYEKNEESPVSERLNSCNSYNSYPTLDSAIIASEAGKHPLAAIEHRLARVTARASAPDASPLDRQLVRDWTAIRDAKAAGRDAA